jgi:hypothetical protein
MLNLKVHHHQQGNSTKIHRYVPRALAWSWFLANTENQTAATRNWLKVRGFDIIMRNNGYIISCIMLH